ncbi:hypothetical protein LR48_Vigan08g034300 [Vigna angularis]|uniref:Dienelactone hydrolase domain-containing protein n=1 Tax=Phaseolus angularis TaxID=3914 RepID=A0A0L9V3I3_PHAAN|nr:hypothetical protein LR48_Vigan08g034300 [Vigna angularis]
MIEGREQNPLLKLVRSHSKRSAKHGVFVLRPYCGVIVSGKGIEIAKPIIEALKRKGASAMGVVGFCGGARTVTNLGKTKRVQAFMLLHPSFITVDDICGVEVPIAILEAEHDSIAPPKLLNQFKQVLDARLELAEIIRGLNEEECEFLIEARGVKSDLELQNQFNAAMTEVEALFSQSG